MASENSDMQRHQAQDDIRISPGELCSRLDAGQTLGREYVNGLVEALPQPAAVFDRNGRFVAMNSICMRLLGHEGIKEFMGVTYKEVLHPSLWEGHGKDFVQAMLAGWPLRYEAECYERHFDVQLAPLRDTQGDLKFILAFAMDVTEKVRLQSQLAAREQFFRDIVEQQTEYVCRALPDTTLTFVNAACARLTGLSQRDLVGAKFLDFTPEEDRADLFANLRILSPRCPAMLIEHKTRLHDGRVCWHQWNNLGLFDEHGNLTEILSVGRDITERKQAEEKERYRRDLDAIFQGLPDALISVDSTMRVAKANKCFHELCDPFLRATSSPSQDVHAPVILDANRAFQKFAGASMSAMAGLSLEIVFGEAGAILSGRHAQAAQAGLPGSFAWRLGERAFRVHVHDVGGNVHALIFKPEPRQAELAPAARTAAADHQEIRHHIRQSLQLVCSLLRGQARELPSGVAQELLHVERRVCAMDLAYEIFNQISCDSGLIDVATLIRILAVRRLIPNGKLAGMRLELNLPVCPLSSVKLVPLVLLLAELMDGMASTKDLGQLSLELVKKNGGVSLRFLIRPGDIPPLAKNTLVQALASQLKAELRFEQSNCLVLDIFTAHQSPK